MKRAAIYARVSRSDQSIAMQLDECTALAKARGWEVVDTFVDEGLSGAKINREGLTKMLEAAKRRRFDVFLVWRGDRVFRSTLHMLATFEQLSALKVDFVSVTEIFDTTTPGGKLLFTISAAFYEHERNTIAERSRAGVAAARRRGKRIGRPRVYVDVTRARKLLELGASVSFVAQRLKVPRTTLLRKLNPIVKVGPFELRACCGMRPDLPHAKGCRGEGAQLADVCPKVPPKRLERTGRKAGGS